MIYLVLIIDFAFPWGMASEFSALALALGMVAVVGKLMLLAVLLVVWETVLAKMRLFRVPQFLGFAFMLSVLAMLTHVMLEGAN
jgi:formate hydrogenlyase subunit 4